jgi:hypothetical protein
VKTDGDIVPVYACVECLRRTELDRGRKRAEQLSQSRAEAKLRRRLNAEAHWEAAEAERLAELKARAGVSA